MDRRLHPWTADVKAGAPSTLLAYIEKHLLPLDLTRDEFASAALPGLAGTGSATGCIALHR